MNYNKMTVRDVPLSGKKVLLRCDFNVPQDKTTGEITSDKRIVAALPTIRYLLDNGAAVIACSHLGKPKGTWKESLTLAPVAKRLSELLGMEVIFAKDIIGEDAKAFARLNAMKADICLSTTPGLDVFQWKRSKDTDWYAHVFHSVGDGTVYRMFGLDYYDAILASGTYIEPRIRKLEKIRHQPAKEFRVVGATFFDSLQKRVESAAPAQHEGTTVLLAPSWGPNAILTRYGDALIDALIATGCRIIIRPHPQSRTAEAAMLERLQKKYPDGEKLSWNFDNDNFDVLNASDIMISDFSGVIFDYAFFFDRPILYADTEFNTAPYDAAWLEEKPWTPSVVPLIGRKLEADDFPNLGEIIDGMIHDTGYAESRRKLCEEAWSCRGKAAENIVDYLTEKRTQLCEARAAAQKTEET